MSAHMRKECATKCGTCIVCLCFVCAACGCYEGSLTTDCCGIEVNVETQDMIYSEGKLDYRDGKWVFAKNPANRALDRQRERDRNAVQHYRGDGTYL